MNYSLFQKTLSSWLASIFISSVALFSAAALVNAEGEFDVACAEGEVCEYLLFPLENPPVDAGDGTPLNTTGNIIEDIVTPNDPEDECLERGGSWDPEQEACNESWLETSDTAGLGMGNTFSNAELIGNVVGGATVWAAGAGYLGETVSGFINSSISSINHAVAGLSDSMSAVSSAGGLTSAANTAVVGADAAAGGVNIGGESVFGDLTGATNSVGGVNIDFGGAVMAGAIAGLVTLVLTGDIKAAAIAAVKSTVMSVVAQAAASYLVSTFGASGVLLGLGPMGWAIMIGLVLSMILCPLVGVELPTGQLVGVSTFLVGKINKKMEGESWEKLLLNNNHLRGVNAEGELKVVIGEVLPEILYLNKLSVFDVIWDKEELGEWFVDQNGDMQFIQDGKGKKWKNENEEGLKEVDWLSMFQTGEQVALIEDSEIASSSVDVDFNQISNSEFQFAIGANASNQEIKILTTGGIQEIYHAEKFRMLAKFRPVLLWFYKIVDNTFLGKVMEREVLAKEGFTLQEKINGDWENVHQWITYADQPRLITLENTGDQRDLRITYEGEYLSLFDVQVQVSENPEYTLTELKSEDLFETLEANDEKYEVVQTGQMHKFVFDLPVIDMTTQSREIFMNTSGYYHPLADWQMIEEYKEQNERLRDLGDMIFSY